MGHSWRYILDGETPVPVCDLSEWTRWHSAFRQTDPYVADTRLNDGTRIMTLFVGVDRSYFGGYPPKLFETVIEGGPHYQKRWRFATWAQADAGHTRVVQAIIEGRMSTEWGGDDGTGLRGCG